MRLAVLLFFSVIAHADTITWEFTSIYDELWYGGAIYSNFDLNGDDCGIYGLRRELNCVQLVPLPAGPAQDFAPPILIPEAPVEPPYVPPVSNVPEPKLTALIGLAITWL